MNETPKKKRSWIRIIIIILVILLILKILISTKVLEKIFDPCEKELSQCNHNCGEGIIGGLCKDACTAKYRKCKGLS